MTTPHVQHAGAKQLRLIPRRTAEQHAEQDAAGPPMTRPKSARRVSAESVVAQPAVAQPAAARLATAYRMAARRPAIASRTAAARRPIARRLAPAVAVERRGAAQSPAVGQTADAAPPTRRPARRRAPGMAPREPAAPEMAARARLTGLQAAERARDELRQTRAAYARARAPRLAVPPQGRDWPPAGAPAAKRAPTATSRSVEPARPPPLRSPPRQPLPPVTASSSSLAAFAHEADLRGQASPRQLPTPAAYLSRAP
jgi:hypothetical protein